MPEEQGQHNPSPGPSPMGQYYLLEKISQGGMAEIYKGLAYDLHGIKRTVVIKKILPQAAANKEFIDMLVAEAKIAVMLSQGNIAQIYDLGKAGDDYFIVMEHVDGRSVSQIMKHCASTDQKVPIPLACHIVAEIAAGLDYMHRRSDEHGQPLHIIHRDVSPQNAIVSYSGTVKIIDFGIAKARTKLETTDVGILKGKFAYMSPEQAEGNPIDHRSDIFSLGVILHELLTGQRLFKAKENRETLRNVRRAHATAPSSVREDVTAELDGIVARALAKDSNVRYQYASELRNDLLRFLHTSYPEFRANELAEYVRALFRRESGKPEAADEDAKTPLLIIDHTQSAIASAVMSEATQVVSSRAPPIMAEYLLTMEEPKIRTRDTGHGTRDLKSNSEEEMSESSYTPAVAVSRGEETTTDDRRSRLLYAAAFALLALGISLAWIYLPKRATPTMNGVDQQTTSATQSTGTPIPQPFGSVTIESNPPGAVVFMDDRETPYRTPATIGHLEAGRQYSIGLFLENYKYSPQRWTAHAGVSDKVQVQMNIDYGGLEVISVPSGARVVINGSDVGRTPITRANLMPGDSVSLEVAAAGYSSWARQVKIEPGKTTTIRAELVRKPDAETSDGKITP